MRFFIFLSLLIACFGMVVLRPVDDEVLSSCERNSTEFSDEWDLFRLKDLLCRIRSWGEALNLEKLSFPDLGNVKAYFSLMLGLHIVYLIFFIHVLIIERIKGNNIFQRDEEPTRQSEGEMVSTEDAISAEVSNPALSTNSNASSTKEHWCERRIEDNFLQRVGLERFYDISDIDFKLEKKSISCLDMDKWNDALHQGLVFRPRKSSSSVSSVDTPSAECIYESISSLGSLNSLRRSWSALSIDLCSRGSSLVISLNSSKSSAAIQSSASGVDSSLISQSSRHDTIWTLYRYPVPASVTSSSPHEVQLRRAEKEYIFIQRPYATPLPVVWDWLRDNFFGNQDGQESHVSPAGQSGQVTQRRQGNQSDQPGPRSKVKQERQHDSAYLINNKKTEVILSGIPASVNEISPFRVWGSMVQLNKQHKDPRLSPEASTSLPNIFKDVGMKNGVAFNVQGFESFSSRNTRNSDEKDSIYCDENLDSISVVAHKTEMMDQARRDAARAKFEQKRQQRPRLNVQQRPRLYERQRPRVHRQQENVKTTPEASSSSFYSILKEETYKQVFVPLLLHAGKEIVLSFLT